MHEGTFFLSVFFECSGGPIRSPGGVPQASCTHKICPPGTPGTPRPQNPDVRPPGNRPHAPKPRCQTSWDGGRPLSLDVIPPGDRRYAHRSRGQTSWDDGRPSSLEVVPPGHRRYAHSPGGQTSRLPAARPQVSMSDIERNGGTPTVLEVSIEEGGV